LIQVWFEIQIWTLKHRWGLLRVARVFGVVRQQVALIPVERIERAIVAVRGEKVMLDSDLAALYEVETKDLLRAVRRNVQRFPRDFAYQLTGQELAILRRQFGTSSLGWGGRRTRPWVFTEQGIAMLSSVLRSDRAVEVNIQIMRTFVRLRQLLSSHADLARKLDELEKKYDKQFAIVFEAIRKLMEPPQPGEPKEMGYHTLIPQADRKPASRRRARTVVRR
jgi:ORF6N domain